MIAHIANLVRWEWFKTRRRWMPWILLILPLLFTQLTLWGTYFAYRAPISINTGMSSSGVFMVEGDSGPTRQQVTVDLNCDDVFEGRVPSGTPPQLGVEDFVLQCQQAREQEMGRRRDMLDRILLPGSVTNALALTSGFGVILRGYVNRCVNDIRRRPSQPLIQWRFHPHTVHRDRRLRSTQGPSDA